MGVSTPVPPARRKIAHLTTVETVGFEWLGGAHHPRFKEYFEQENYAEPLEIPTSSSRSVTLTERISRTRSSGLKG